MCDAEKKRPGCFEGNIPLEGIAGNHLNNLLDLSSDMKCLLKSHQMTDIVLSISGKDKIHCHKDILRFRSKWFYNSVCEADSKGADVIEVDEDPRVMEAVLCYIYTGDLRLLESLNVYLVEVYEAAEKYGFIRLREILKRMLQKTRYREVVKYTQFQWIVRVENGRVMDAACPALYNFTTCGDDKWQLKWKCVSSSNEDDYSIVIYLERQTEDPHTTTHNVHLTLRISDCNDKPLYSISDNHDICVDGEYSLSKHIPLTQLLEKSNSLLTDSLLTFSFQLTFWAKVGFLTKFRLTGPYCRYISNELVHLSEDMFNVLRDGKNHDISFSRCHVNMHNYILLFRSGIPKEFIAELETRAGFGKRLWISFASFLYTGQSRFLDEHGRTVYSALSEMKLTTAKEKYSNFLFRNLTLENAFCILNDAVCCEDDSLSRAAADFLARKSEIETDPQVWIRMAKDKKSLLKFFSQSYTFKQFL